MKKWFQNFWYYYRIPAIIVLVILACVLWFRIQGKTAVNEDYSAAVILPRGCSEEQLGKIKKVLEQAGHDQNGDGSVTVNIHAYRFAIGVDGQDPKEVAGLDADLVGKLSGIFFTDAPEQFEKSTNGIGTAADAVPVSSISGFSGCGIDDLFLLIRVGADEKYTELVSALAQ